MRRIVTQEQLRAALERHRTMRHLRLGDALVQEGLITVKERDKALALQKSDGRKRLGRILVEMGALRPLQLKRVLMEQLGFPCVDLSKFELQPEALAAVPAEVAGELRAIPLCVSDTRMAVALEDPTDWLAIQSLARITGKRIDPVLASPTELCLALRRMTPARIVL